MGKVQCYQFSDVYFSIDHSVGKYQRRIQAKTQNYLNCYAVDGLRTLCIAKRVSIPSFTFQGSTFLFYCDPFVFLACVEMRN